MDRVLSARPSRRCTCSFDRITLGLGLAGPLNTFAVYVTDYRGHLLGGCSVAVHSIHRIRLQVRQRDVTCRLDRLRHRMSLQVEVICQKSRAGLAAFHLTDLIAQWRVST